MNYQILKKVKKILDIFKSLSYNTMYAVENQAANQVNISNLYKMSKK